MKLSLIVLILSAASAAHLKGTHQEEKAAAVMTIKADDDVKVEDDDDEREIRSLGNSDSESGDDSSSGSSSGDDSSSAGTSSGDDSSGSSSGDDSSSASSTSHSDDDSAGSSSGDDGSECIDSYGSSSCTSYVNNGYCAYYFCPTCSYAGYCDLACGYCTEDAPVPSPTSSPVPKPTASPVPKPTAHPIASPANDDEGTGTSGAGGKTCFSGDARVQLESGVTKSFRELAVGDSILSASRDGTISYSAVVFLPHKENDKRASFIELNTESGKSLKLTKGHLLPLCDGSLKAANDIKVGSCLRTVDGEDKVFAIANFDMNGVYTAVTENEFLVVNGIIASPFAASGALVHAFYNATDMEEWCASNDWLAFENARHPHMQALMEDSKPSQDCLTMLKEMFENFKEEPVGWGVDGFGYRNNWVNPATPEENAKKEKTMAFKLAGWD